MCVREKCVASEHGVNMCGSVYESAYGLPVECVGVFVLLCFLTFNVNVTKSRGNGEQAETPEIFVSCNSV